jgi:hypothetical protein
MDVASFTRSLVKAFSDLPFAEDVDLRTEAFVVKGRVHLRALRANLFQRANSTIAFALIEEGRRVWGMDHDALRGWHEHPLSAPETHRTSRQKQWQK